jgi:hypothetical protein
VNESGIDAGLTEGGVQRAADQAAASFASDVRTNQFARRQLREEVAQGSEDLDASDVDVDVNESGVDVGLTEGGESRQAVESAAENSEFSRDELTATVTEDGETAVQLTDDALAERVAGENPDVSADDLRVVEREFQGASERRPGGSRRVIELTEDAAAERRLEQARAENPDANLTLSEGEDGTPRVKVEERFDDGGRFLLIPGGEKVVEDAADATGEFLRGAGGTIGAAIGTPNDFIFSQLGVTEKGDISGVTRAAGEGAASLLNVPGVLETADEAGEVVGAGGAAAANSVLEGSTDPVEEFGGEATAAGTYLGGAVVESARANPVQTGAMLAGSVVGSVGLFRAAGSASTTSGQLARGIVQPGEELALAAGRSVGLTRGALRARLPDASSIRGSDALDSTPDLPGDRFSLDADALDAARGVSGPGRLALARGRIRRALNGETRAPDVGDSDAPDLDVFGGDRGQATLELETEGSSSGSRQEFTDFRGESPGRGGRSFSRDEALEGSARDQLSGDITDRALSQRRQNAGDFDGNPRDPTRGGFSRTGDSEVTTRVGDDVTTTAPRPGGRPIFARGEAQALLDDAQQPQVTPPTTDLSGVEDTALGGSSAGETALGVDTELGQTPAVDEALRPATEPTERSAPVEDSDVGGDSDTETSVDVGSEIAPAFRSDARSETRFDTRTASETETALETETGLRSEFGFRSDSRRSREAFGDDDAPDFESDSTPFAFAFGSDTFGTGFRDFELDRL